MSFFHTLFKGFVDVSTAPFRWLRPPGTPDPFKIIADLHLKHGPEGIRMALNQGHGICEVETALQRAGRPQAPRYVQGLAYEMWANRQGQQGGVVEDFEGGEEGRRRREHGEHERGERERGEREREGRERGERREGRERGGEHRGGEHHGKAGENPLLLGLLSGEIAGESSFAGPMSIVGHECDYGGDFEQSAILSDSGSLKG